MEVSGTEQVVLPWSFASSTESVQSTAQLTAVMRSPMAASKTAEKVLLPASGSTVNLVSGRAAEEVNSTRGSRSGATRAIIGDPFESGSHHQWYRRVRTYQASGGVSQLQRLGSGALDLALLLVSAHRSAQLPRTKNRQGSRKGARQQQPRNDLERRDHGRRPRKRSMMRYQMPPPSARFRTDDDSYPTVQSANEGNAPVLRGSPAPAPRERPRAPG